MPTTSLSTTPVTFIGIMEARKTALELSSQEICTAIGFEQESTLSLIRSGIMKMPLTKIPALAVVLQLDAAELLRVALREADPELAKLIEETFYPLHLTATARDQIKHQRNLSGNTVGEPITLQCKEPCAGGGLIMPKTTAKAPENLPPHDHRFSAVPLKDILKIRMTELGIKNVDLQRILGYPAANVIAMIKSGSMRLPEGKAIEVADALQLDRTFLLGKVISENNAELWVTITTVMGDPLVSASELALVHFVREALDGQDVNLAESPDFVQTITPALNAIVERENQLAQAAINHCDA